MNSHQTCVWYMTETQRMASFGRHLRKRFTSRGSYRYGQAFFNSLSFEDQARLRASLYDPFQSDEPAVSALAVGFLTTKEN